MEEEKYQTQSKRQGKASAELKRMSPERAWPALANFCNLHKWFPTVSACRQVEGFPGQPDLFRYCASAPVDNDESTIKWSEEKLLTIDPIPLFVFNCALTWSHLMAMTWCMSS